jgi:hypothetical protein
MYPQTLYLVLRKLHLSYLRGRYLVQDKYPTQDSSMYLRILCLVQRKLLHSYLRELSLVRSKLTRVRLRVRLLELIAGLYLAQHQMQSPQVLQPLHHLHQQYYQPEWYLVPLKYLIPDSPMFPQVLLVVLLKLPCYYLWEPYLVLLKLIRVRLRGRLLVPTVGQRLVRVVGPIT